MDSSAHDHGTFTTGRLTWSTVRRGLLLFVAAAFIGIAGWLVIRDGSSTSDPAPSGEGTAQPFDTQPAAQQQYEDFSGASTAPVVEDYGPEPEPLATVALPSGAQITRLDGATGDRVHAIYSAAQIFNADETVGFLAIGDVFVSTATGDVLDSYYPPADYGFWSPVNPDLMIVPSGSELHLFDVTTGTIDRTITLSGYVEANFPVRSGPSATGDRVVVKARRTSDDGWYALAVDLESGEVVRAIAFDDHGFELGDLPEDKARRATVTPSGRHIALEGYADGEYQRMVVLDWATGDVVYTSPPNNGVECPGDHGDFALGPDGGDVFVGICKVGGASWSSSLGGSTVVLSLPDGALRPLDGIPPFSHYSGRSWERPGWVYGSSFGPDATLAAFRIDGSRIEYYVDPQGAPAAEETDYWAETQATPSPSGRFVVYSTSWRQSYPEGATFLLDLRGL